MTQEADLWTSMEADRLASATYDPLSSMTMSQITGGPTKNFPAEAFAPEPDWLTKLWQPWDNFGTNLWESGGEVIEYSSEKLPELLWERGLTELLPKQQVVSEGAGVTVLHTQPAQAGGAPAQPTQQIIPGQLPFFAAAAGAPKAAAISTSVLVVVGAVVLLILFKR